MGLFSIFGKSSTVYFPGCYTYFKYKEHFELYQKIFSRLGIDFKLIEKKICCGLPALESGYDNEARKLARRNFEIFKEENVSQIITNSPCCYKMFLNYGKYLPDWNIAVLNVWKIILEKLEEKPWLIKSHISGNVLYQDSCYLGRYCNIYDEPRRILEIIGYKVKDIADSREKSICCGSCGGLMITNPPLADKIARERLLQVKRAGIKRIIVGSMQDYYILNKNSKELGIDILELSEVLGLALGIETPEGIPSDFEEELKEEDDVNQKIKVNLE